MRLIDRSGRALALTILSMLVLSAAPSIAQPWPQRMVRVIVPLPPGIPTDLVCRLFADRLSERWRQPVVVENRQGVDGIPAVSGFVSARDDHTLLCSFPGIVTINPLIYEKLPYDPSRDLVPVATAWMRPSPTSWRAGRKSRYETCTISMLALFNSAAKP